MILPHRRTISSSLLAEVAHPDPPLPPTSFRFSSSLSSHGDNRQYAHYRWPSSSRIPSCRTRVSNRRSPYLFFIVIPTVDSSAPTDRPALQSLEPGRCIGGGCWRYRDGREGLGAAVVARIFVLRWCWSHFDGWVGWADELGWVG
ncbi:unnamed protein product [Linum trigynum]|uniref:Uncharacterized protein n=1 Tax=Linum trigynum TaxID=586398 RepID=A0AAV2DHU5_9ROSI